MELKQQILESMLHECEVIKHLITKVPEDGLDYRPTPAQRSTLELMRYATCCGILAVRGAINGNWDHAEAMYGEAESVPVDGLAGAVDAQAQALRDALESLSDEDLRTRDAGLPWGTEVKLGRALIGMGLGCLTAYRMQLFLYAKAAGNAEIGSPNCWAGVDRPPEQ